MTNEWKDQFIRVGDAARLLGVDLRTLHRWSRQGRIQEYRDRRGWRWYKRTDILKLQREREQPPQPVPRGRDAT